MTRATDFCFDLSWSDVWSLDVQHEPLICFVCLPFALSSPNLTQRREVLGNMEGLLFLTVKRDILRQLLSSARSLCPMPVNVLR